jgi:hypothetical protein
METMTYIKALVTPKAQKPTASRRVWSIDLETCWLPFFTATNTIGDTAIPHEALGAPLRLGYNKDGTVKFSLSGKPVIRVAKELSDSVRLVRDNFTAGLMAYANGVITENPEAYKAEIALCREAGKPIISRDNTMLQSAYSRMVADQLEAELKAKAKAEPPADTTTKPPAVKKPKARKPAKANAVKVADTAADTHDNGATPDTTKEPVLVS